MLGLNHENDYVGEVINVGSLLFYYMFLCHENEAFGFFLLA